MKTKNNLILAPDPCARCGHEAHRHDRDEDTEICLECCHDHSSEAFKTRYHSFMPCYGDETPAPKRPDGPSVTLGYIQNRFEVEEW